MAKLHAQLVVLSKDATDFVVLLAKIFYLYFQALCSYFVPESSPKSLEGKVILITGSAGGIGRQVCLQLAKTGAILVCWDVNKQINDEFLYKLVAQTKVKALSYQVDITDRLQVKEAIAKVLKEVGEIQIIINNAGIMPCKPFLQHSPDELTKSFQVNVISHFWIMKELLPRMIARNEGHIVTVCSAAGLIGTRNLAPYSGTKHAIHGFIEGLKEEIRHDPGKPQINFTTVYPYSCDTGLLTGVQSHSRFPSIVKSVLQPEHVAEKLVDGLRRNYEFVYIPGFVRLAGTMAKCLLPDVQRLSSDFLNCHVGPVGDLTGTNPDIKKLLA